MDNGAKITRGTVVALLFLGWLTELHAQDLTPAAPIRRWPATFEVGADYVFLYYTPSQFSSLSTTGSLSDPVPGAWVQPNTRFLNGNMSDPQNAALLGTLTWWLADPEAVSLQAAFLYAAERTHSASYASNAAGSPLLARPFFNVVTNSEAARLRSSPGTRSGSIADSLSSQVMSGELNMRFYSSGVYLDGSGVNFLFGARWFRFQEEYDNLDTTIDPGVGGATFSHADRFAADNQFWGGQIGAELQYKAFGIIDLAVLGKVGLGTCNQIVTIEGQTVRTQGGAAFVDSRQGFYAQPTNIGTYRYSTFTFLPEGSVKASMFLTPSLRLRASYGIFCLTNVVRPIDELDRRLNPQPLGTVTPSSPFSPRQPTFNQQSLWGQMFNVGLEFHF